MLKTFVKNTALFAFLILFSQPVFSVPAFPYFITMKQPSGEEITLKMKGDERIKWMESEEGYTLLYDSNKNIVYATLDNNGDLIPSKWVVQDIHLRSSEISDFLKETPRFLSFSPRQKEAFNEINNSIEQIRLRSTGETKSTIGIAKGICALVQFPDKAMKYTVDDFSQLMNQIGYQNGNQKGSVRDFYLENSYGELDLTITVVGIYTATHNHAYYGGQNHESDLAREAANFAFNNQAIIPADYDNDNDDFIDTFHFLFAGYGEEAGGGTNCIWSHKSTFGNALTFNGKLLNTYSCSPELRGNSGENITYIGVITHELCHIFGAPDFYDTTYSGFEGTGAWDLMADGSWNNQGATPSHINMYQKIAFNWVNPVKLSSSQNIVDMPNSAQNPVAYIIESSVPAEYYVLENRQRIGFDANVPGAGLLIYHVSVTKDNIRRNNVNNTHPQRVYPVNAHASAQIPNSSPESYGNINSSSCTYPNTGIYKNDEFTDQSTPAAFLWNGSRLGKPIVNITLKNRLISFNFMPNEYELNLAAQVVNNKVNITWETPYTNKAIQGYNIYRNGKFIQFTNNTTYREQVNEEGTYKYGISVVFDDNESPIQEIEVVFNWTAINPVVQHPVNVYPNPVKSGESLTINLGDIVSKADLSIYNVSGKLVLQIQATSPIIEQTINLSQGIYFLRITKEQQIETIKFYVK